MIIIDAHVHIYHCFELELFFSSAFANFWRIANKLDFESFTPVVVTADWSNYRWFDQLKSFAAKGKSIGSEATDRFEILLTPDPMAVTIRDGSGRQFYVVAGRKIITAENLEVLALCSAADFADGVDLINTVMDINVSDAIPVIPWAVGKWLGRRGKIVSTLIESPDRPYFCLCDNRNRPWLWPWPNHFKIAEENRIPILSGSDPLHFPSEAVRVGSFGFCLDGDLDSASPARDLRSLLRHLPDSVQRYGQLEKVFPFLLNQIRMQIFKKKWRKELLK